MTQQQKLNLIGFALKKSQLFLQVCLQPLNKTDHWPIDTIGKSVITKNLSQKLIRRDRGKSSLEVEESKKTDFYHGETRTKFISSQGVITMTLCTGELLTQSSKWLFRKSFFSSNYDSLFILY